MTIREHPLAWRWTNAKYAVLPDETLAQMQPVEKGEAARLFERSKRLVVGSGLCREELPTILRHSADVPNEVGRLWLREQQPDLAVPVVVSWQRDQAIRTTWQVFTAHWNAFCYPSSDDVLVWPDSERWALFFSHEEEFEFGRADLPGSSSPPR